LVDSVVRLSFAVHDILARAAAEHGLSVTQLRLLGILRGRTPPMTAIAEYLRLDRSSVTGLVDRAEGRGLVSRTASTEDGRVTIVTVTSTGAEVGLRVAATVTAEIEALMDHVSGTDRDSMVRIAESVLSVQVEKLETTAR
jgi:DNA-binding MarR family transcriptional regulator